MRGRFYPEVFSRSWIELVMPSPPEPAETDEVYRSELVAGVIRPASRDRLIAIARRLRDDAAIESPILGGTELQMILDEASGSAARALTRRASTPSRSWTGCSRPDRAPAGEGFVVNPRAGVSPA
jgi:aspartate/glutamate racemase